MDDKRMPARITIDCKKMRIRIYKSTLHQMGNPEFLQFLINPDTMTLAIKPPDSPDMRDRNFRVRQSTLYSDCSVEVYGTEFITRMLTKKGIFNRSQSYSVEGRYFPGPNVAVFPLNAMSVLERQEEET